jgi:hypothetical protein
MKPAPNIKNTLDKLNRSIRLKAWLKEHPVEKDENYNPNLYLPSVGNHLKHLKLSNKT